MLTVVVVLRRRIDLSAEFERTARKKKKHATVELCYDRIKIVRMPSAFVSPRKLVGWHTQSNRTHCLGRGPVGLNPRASL